MKVCILQTVLDPYKGANHLPLFAAASTISFVIVCNRSKAKASDLPKNVEVVTIPGRTGPYYYGVADARFASLVLRRYPAVSAFWKQFDVLHFNQVMGPAFRRLWARRQAMLFTIHHPVTVDREMAMQESHGIGRLLWYMKYMKLVAWQKTMCRVCDRVMTVSRTVQDRLQQDYGCPVESISIIPNGVDGSVFIPDAQLPLFDVIALGSFMHPRKGFRYLADAYRALAEKGYRIADVGRRSDEQIAILCSIPGVTIHGTVDQQTVRSLVQRSSALLSTSLYEGFGLSLIEALSCGRPAFAFGGGAVPEVLTPIDASLIVPLRDTVELVRRTEAFLQLPEAQRHQRGQQYRDAVLKLYSLTSSANLLRQLYVQMKREALARATSADIQESHHR
ncbi:MAG: group 1 glycosyl transferase [Candidatus Peregrinibacteria bacterium Greene1014_49]|nr:MAG: group 1 glycosyl transferase [Candidatus Peregrinibacteria bacterium Greene1014_49]